MTPEQVRGQAPGSSPGQVEAGDYYARKGDEHRKASRWRGSGAAALGLTGHVEPGEFRRVLQGYVPETDIRLGRLRDGEHEHRPGVDITLSAPKSVSLEGAAGRAGFGQGDARARCGGAGDAGPYRDAAAADPALEPGGAALGAGERAHARGGDLPAHHRSRNNDPQASHALRGREHDAPHGTVAECRDRPAAPVGEADRGLLPQRAGRTGCAGKASRCVRR